MTVVKPNSSREPNVVVLLVVVSSNNTLNTNDTSPISGQKAQDFVLQSGM